jgi:hypothetical protein
MLTIPGHLKSVVNRDGAIILDTPNNAITPLNSTGAFIWERLERGTVLDDIITELAQETSTDRATVAADVGLFVSELKTRQFLVG